MVDKTVLQTEYDKAAKRLVEQRRVLQQTIIAAEQKDFPSLAAVAKKRLPKLQEVHDITVGLVAELGKALGYDQVQLDIDTVLSKQEDPPPPSAAKKQR